MVFPFPPTFGSGGEQALPYIMLPISHHVPDAGNTGTRCPANPVLPDYVFAASRLYG